MKIPFTDVTFFGGGHEFLGIGEIAVLVVVIPAVATARRTSFYHYMELLYRYLLLGMLANLKLWLVMLVINYVILIYWVVGGP